MIAGFSNSNPREVVAVAEEDAAGGDVAAATVTTMDLTVQTYPMAGFM